MVLAADGRPDFGGLRARLAGPARRVNGAARAVTLMAFDVSHLDGRAVRRVSYARRRELLEELGLDGPVCWTPRYFVGDADRVVAAVGAQGLEGVVAKRLDSVYAEGRRSRAWINYKLRRRERLLVTGSRERAGALPEFRLARRDEQGRPAPAGSASLGLDADRRATFAGRAGPARAAARRRAPGWWRALGAAGDRGSRRRAWIAGRAGSRRGRPSRRRGLVRAGGGRRRQR